MGLSEKVTLKLHGSYIEEQSFAEQQRLLSGRDVGVILDVGANVGNTVAKYAELFPQCEIFGFEPYPPAFERLAGRFTGQDRIHLFPYAISTEAHSPSLYINEYADTNSLLPRPSAARRYYASDNIPKGTVAVSAITLDSFAREHHLERIGILKMDIQGGEGRALAGAKSLLERQQIDLIFSEVVFVPHYEGALHFHEFTSLLEQFGYTLFNVHNLTWGRNGQLRFADAIYVSRDLRRNVIDAEPEEP